MTQKQLKNELRRATLQSTPDVLSKIMENPPSREQVMGAAKAGRNSSPARRWQPALALAAVCLFCFGMFQFAQPKVDTVVSIDVNPSLQMSVDTQDKVVECKALNTEAEGILKDLKLKRQDVDAAANAIIDSMVKTGYLSAGSNDNAILVSVATENSEKADKIQAKISTSIKTVLDQNNATAKVLQQKETVITDELQSFAQAHNVSVGKADLIQKLISQDASLDAVELTNMSLKDLTNLIDQKDLKVADMVTKDTSESVEDDLINSSSHGDTTSSESSASEEGSSSEAGSSEQNSSSHSSSALYCERCGRLVSECQNSCDASKPKLYCSRDGKLKSECGHYQASSQPPVPSEPEDVDEPGLYCPYCGNWADECQGSCKGGKVRYCDKCGRLESACHDSCAEDGTIQLSESYCPRCGQKTDVCEGKCDSSLPEIYCKQCGRLKTVCKGTCEYLLDYHIKPEVLYCERCGKPEYLCMDSCDQSSPKIHCKYCGKLKTEHGPDCPGYDEDDFNSSTSPPKKEDGYCPRCGLLKSDCQDSCDSDNPDIYCEECGGRLPNHSRRCSEYKKAEESSDSENSSNSSSSSAASS